jgi:dTDP-glucose 4,6-dehydratase
MMSDARDPVNIGNPDEITVLEFAHEIIRLTQARSRILFKPLPKDDPRQRRPDIARARRLLRWEPKVKLATGLARTIAHFQDRA